MPQIDDIRRLWSEGRDVTEIARMTGHDRKTVRKYLQIDDFSPKTPAPRPKGASKLDPFKDYVDRTLEADLHEWRKQRHTATRIYGELLEMGYEGKYSLVQCYVRERKREMRQASSAFMDLVWAPGTAQCDFGEADFWWRGERRRLFFLVLAFPQSNMGWFQVFGGTTAECVCEGLMAIFLHIGGVPHRIVFDNATGVGRRVAGEVRESRLFRRFRLHFGFEATFCNPHAGHEKGSVESKVGFVRRNAFVPVPTVGDLAGYNESLMGVADSLLESISISPIRRIGHSQVHQRIFASHANASAPISAPRASARHRLLPLVLRDQPETQHRAGVAGQVRRRQEREELHRQRRVLRELQARDGAVRGDAAPARQRHRHAHPDLGVVPEALEGPPQRPSVHHALPSGASPPPLSSGRSLVL